MTLGWPWPKFRQGQFGSLGIWTGKDEIFHFSVIIVLLGYEMKSSPITYEC